MNTITETDALDAQVEDAQAALATAERALSQAARSGQDLNEPARVVEAATARLEQLQARRTRQETLERLRVSEAARAADAQKAHGAAEKANAAALKRERTQLRKGAQDAAESVLEAVTQLRAAVTQLRVYGSAVGAAARRLEALGLPLTDEYGTTYSTGARTEGSKAAVVIDGEGFTSPDLRQVQNLVKWAEARVFHTEFHGGASGGAYLHGLDPAVQRHILDSVRK